LRSVNLLALSLLLSSVEQLSAQGPPPVQAHILATATSTEFVGIGAGARVSLGPRISFSASLSPGSRRGSVAFRSEVVAVFHLNIDATAGWGLYGGGGLAFETKRPDSGNYLLLIAGAEPNSRSGPFVELGVGGGARLNIGYRLRLR
jgi:hypothetical protein